MNVEYIKRLINKKNSKITVLSSSDIKYRDKVNFICKKHGEFSRRLDHFLESNCIECQKEIKLEKQKNKFIKNSNIVHDNKYKYDKVNYINNKTNVIIICEEHGEFEQRPDNHIAGAGCTYCNYKLSNKDFINKSNKIHNNKYLYDKTEYTSNKNIVIITCEKHGDFNQLARVHLDGFGCKKCSESIGENKISKILEEKNIEFIREYKFSDCRNKYPLPFDFYLPDSNTIIEYNGIQHYEPIEFFGGQKSLDYRKKLDIIKSDYCEENNIKLVIIKYDDNAYDIISNILK